MGRAKPKKENDQPTIYRMRVFAPNEVVARSKFFNLLSYQKKLKRSNAELLATQEILEAPTNSIKNYGIAFRYHSRTAIHNMYKEYRAGSNCHAVSKLYAEMAGTHKADLGTLQIIRVAKISKKSDLRRPNTI